MPWGLSIDENVRYWHLADITFGARNVRYWGVKQTSLRQAAISANDPKRTRFVVVVTCCRVGLHGVFREAAVTCGIFGTSPPKIRDIYGGVILCPNYAG
jgi:hypothetical protein